MVWIQQLNSIIISQICNIRGFYFTVCRVTITRSYNFRSCFRYKLHCKYFIFTCFYTQSQLKKIIILDITWYTLYVFWRSLSALNRPSNLINHRDIAHAIIYTFEIAVSSIAYTYLVLDNIYKIILILYNETITRVLELIIYIHNRE